jgi:hypothetical protein
MAPVLAVALAGRNTLGVLLGFSILHGALGAGAPVAAAAAQGLEGGDGGEQTMTSRTTCSGGSSSTSTTRLAHARGVRLQVVAPRHHRQWRRRPGLPPTVVGQYHNHTSGDHRFLPFSSRPLLRRQVLERRRLPRWPRPSPREVLAVCTLRARPRRLRPIDTHTLVDLPSVSAEQAGLSLLH